MLINSSIITLMYSFASSYAFLIDVLSLSELIILSLLTVEKPLQMYESLSKPDNAFE